MLTAPPPPPLTSPSPSSGRRRAIMSSAPRARRSRCPWHRPGPRAGPAAAGLAGVLSTELLAWFYGATRQGRSRWPPSPGRSAPASAWRGNGSIRSGADVGATQLRLMIKPLLIGTFCLVGCLFVFYQGRLPFRVWPLAWAVSAAGAARRQPCRLTRADAALDAAGRLARKIAIVGLGDFSREFIERLQGEPGKYQIVGIYDDRIRACRPARCGVDVRGTVADLVARSREEQIDIIVVALPLSAADRIKAILDQLSSTVADIVLTTDLAGLRFSRTQFEGIGRNPVVSVREGAAEGLAGAGEGTGRLRRGVARLAAAVARAAGDRAADQARLARPGAVPPAAHGVQQPAVPLLQVPLDAPGRGGPAGRQADHPQRPPDHARRPGHPQAVDRRAAATAQRAERHDVPGGPPPARPQHQGGGQAVHRRRAAIRRAAPREARHHGMGPGERLARGDGDRRPDPEAGGLRPLSISRTGPSASTSASWS